MKNVILTILAVVAFSGAVIADDNVFINNINFSANGNNSNTYVAIGGNMRSDLPADFRGRIDAIGITIDEIETVCYDGDGNFDFMLKNKNLIRSEEAVYKTNPLPRSEWVCKKL